ncbi:HPP family protein [Pseudoalteromonas sp. NZS71]|uniref:HPP family protein n=1 Tax=unclassified Pseudoalteromonas TaxID=194690 RepID=UPI000404891F|nr:MULTISPECIES: HPP family protein [unclassified Pseudoalteromonas]MBH0063529.1 HPP family protein [Pseudoalteromonas sp. NZS71]MBH0094565.1 HPP family protein [Pseudoalteromonas sp. SCQQ13]
MNRYLLAVIAGFGAFIAIGLLSLTETNFNDIVLIMAPFGATTVLVFGVPDSPLAQAKNVIFGHLITAFIGILFYQYVDVTPLTIALATGLGVTSMLVSKTTHPPAGANPILIMLSGQSWLFLVTPVLIGSIVIVLVGKGLQKLQSHYFKSEC